jgi:hypothetical protein
MATLIILRRVLLADMNHLRSSLMDTNHHHISLMKIPRLGQRLIILNPRGETLWMMMMMTFLP